MFQDSAGLAAAARRAAREHVERLLFTLFGWTVITKTSPLGDQDFAKAFDEAESQRPIQRVEPFGLRSRAVTGKLRQFFLRLGSSNVFGLGFAPDASVGPSDLEPGEVCIYCGKNGTRVFLDKDGNIKVDAASGANVTINGAEVNLNAGSNGVARIGDSVDADTGFRGWVGQVDYALGLISPFSLSNRIGTISSGSGTVKAGD